MSNVYLYTLSTCSHCRSAKKLFQKYNVDYDFLDVDKLQGEDRAGALDKLESYNPRKTFPTIIIDDNVIVGYKEDDIKKALGV